MKFKNPLYYCTECKTIENSLENLLFVEEKSAKGFCSEDCIEDFYRPLIRHFEGIELSLRKKMGIESEQIEFNFSNNQFTEEVISTSDEVWRVNNELDESIFSYIKYYPNFTGVVVCKMYNGEASFVFLCTATRSRELLTEFRAGEQMTDSNLVSNDEEIPEDFSDEDFNFMQLLENKKSKLLAELLEKRNDDDIPFENFMDYEYCYPETLDNPDEVFENRDNDGDSFFIYIKSFIKNGNNFFYIISCLKRKESEDLPEVNVFPVLAFPTNDMNLYSEFRIGKKISGLLKN